jgi:hypothetical protein
VLWRRPGQRRSASAAPLRLALAPAQGRLAVRVLKRRGAELAQPIVLDLACAPGAPLYPLPDETSPHACGSGRCAAPQGAEFACSPSTRMARTAASPAQPRRHGARLPHRKAS